MARARAEEEQSPKASLDILCLEIVEQRALLSPADAYKREQIRHYDRFSYNVSPAIFDRVKRYHARNVIELIKTRPSLKSKVLYVAAGSGHEIKLIAPGIGTDISFGCARSIRDSGFPAVVCDVESLPFKDECFDFVFGNSFHHFFDFKSAFTQMHRVCRTGGRLTLGPEAHRYSLDQYIYNTVFSYWKFEKNVLKLTPGMLTKFFHAAGMKNIEWYFKGTDPIGAVPALERFFDRAMSWVPNRLFFWMHFYITGIK